MEILLGYVNKAPNEVLSGEKTMTFYSFQGQIYNVTSITTMTVRIFNPGTIPFSSLSFNYMKVIFPTPNNVGLPTYYFITDMVIEPNGYIYVTGRYDTAQNYLMSKTNANDIIGNQFVERLYSASYQQQDNDYPDESVVMKPIPVTKSYFINDKFSDFDGIYVIGFIGYESGTMEVVDSESGDSLDYNPDGPKNYTFTRGGIKYYLMKGEFLPYFLATFITKKAWLNKQESERFSDLNPDTFFPSIMYVPIEYSTFENMEYTDEHGNVVDALELVPSVSFVIRPATGGLATDNEVTFTVNGAFFKLSNVSKDGLLVFSEFERLDFGQIMRDNKFPPAASTNFPFISKPPYYNATLTYGPFGTFDIPMEYYTPYNDEGDTTFVLRLEIDLCTGVGVLKLEDSETHRVYNKINAALCPAVSFASSLAGSYNRTTENINNFAQTLLATSGASTMANAFAQGTRNYFRDTSEDAFAAIQNPSLKARIGDEIGFSNVNVPAAAMGAVFNTAIAIGTFNRNAAIINSYRPRVNGTNGSFIDFIDNNCYITISYMEVEPSFIDQMKRIGYIRNKFENVVDLINAGTSPTVHTMFIKCANVVLHADKNYRKGKANADKMVTLDAEFKAMLENGIYYTNVDYLPVS